MDSWDLLDERAEAELHKTRLLNVEEKPFKRITKRVSTITSTISNLTGKDAKAAAEADPTATWSLDQLREDLTLDFAAFDSSIARLQFLHDANERERARYDEDRQRIVKECEDVRARNAELRRQLEGARATLAQRKKFDELADRITSNRLLRPREDQLANLAKLEDECRELERESETYTETWRERRGQFNRIMNEGTLLRRQIRDEKEEVDRREGMVDETAEDDAAPPTPTLRPEANDGPTPRPDLPDGQPRALVDEGGTPSYNSQTAAGTPVVDFLQIPGAASDGASKNASTAVSAVASPHAPRDDGEDVEMVGGELAGQNVPAVDTPEPGNEKMEVDE